MVQLTKHAQIYAKNCFMKSTPWANIIKLFTIVIYHHSMVISSSCVINGNCCGMAVNCHGKKFFNTSP